MPGAAVFRLQMILKIRVAEAPVVMIAAHSAHGSAAALLAALIAAVLAGVAVVEAQAAVVADGYGAAGALIAVAAQLVILADVALGAGRAVLFLHALRALVALLAPIGRVSKAHTAVVAMGFNPALVVAFNGAEQAVTHIIAAKMVVVAVRTIEAVVVVVPKGVDGHHRAWQQRKQHHKHQQDADDATSCVRFYYTIISSLKIIQKIFLCVLFGA